MICTNNGIRITCQFDIPYVSLSEVSFLVRVGHCNGLLVRQAVDSGAYFRLISHNDTEVLDSIPSLENQIKLRRDYENTEIYSACDPFDKTTYCRCCSQLGKVRIMGQKLSGRYECTVVQCQICKSNYTLNPKQAHCLRSSMCERHTPVMLKTPHIVEQYIRRIKPDEIFHDEWLIYSTDWDHFFSI